jgi:hypothetical protein
LESDILGFVGVKGLNKYIVLLKSKPEDLLILSPVIIRPGFQRPHIGIESLFTSGHWKKSIQSCIYYVDISDLFIEDIGSYHDIKESGLLL